MKRRVVITACGVVSSLGGSPGEILESFHEERVRFARSAHDQEIAVCPLPSFNVKNYTGPCKDVRYLHRGAQLAVAAALAAWKDARLADTDLTEGGLFIGMGPNLDIGGEFPDIQNGQLDHRSLQALWILRFLPNTAASVIARLTGLRGQNLTISTACASSLQAIGEAYRKIKDGYLDIAFAGGGDSRLSRGGILAYKKAGALYRGSGEPAAASRPFDANRGGFVPGEGGAFFVLESREHADRRGAAIIGEICGYGCSLDAAALTAPDSGGVRGKASIAAALTDAQMDAAAIELVTAHGTGTRLNDASEANILHEFFGPRQPLVIALKSWIGHTASACGALELAISLICLRKGYIPEIRNLRQPCHEQIHFQRRSTEASLGTFLIENFGFGGQNAALIVRGAPETE